MGVEKLRNVVSAPVVLAALAAVPQAVLQGCEGVRTQIEISDPFLAAEQGEVPGQIVVVGEFPLSTLEECENSTGLFEIADVGNFDVEPFGITEGGCVTVDTGGSDAADYVLGRFFVPDIIAGDPVPEGEEPTQAHWWAGLSDINFAMVAGGNEHNSSGTMVCAPVQSGGECEIVPL